ncbi:hypothetical protein BGP_0016 [Beggiatoa sp. PS]|nr:hypothetical protein BGP_0016 [Beggiatoa sp. PS]
MTPHESAHFLRKQHYLPVSSHNPHFLSSYDAYNLKLALSKDAEGYLYNGMLSIGAGIQSLLNQNYGWATVKFYYAIFYLARAILGVNQLGIVYDGSKPFSILAQTGESLTKRKGNTHKLILSLFQKYKPTHIMLSNDIDSQCPLDWLMKQREMMNYKLAVMPDPQCPEQYQEIITSSKTLRQWLNIYLLDEIEVYCFDKDHAGLAYPFKFLIHTFHEFQNNQLSCRYFKSNHRFIKKLFSDKSGTFSFLTTYFEWLT